MSRTILNFLLDSVLLTIFVTLVFVSVVVRFVFPIPTEAAGWTLWGGSYDAWSAAQFAIVSAMALAVLLHVMLHWSWVCGVISQRLSHWRGRTIRIDEGQRTIYGVGLLIVLLNLVGVSVAVAALMIEGPAS